MRVRLVLSHLGQLGALSVIDSDSESFGVEARRGFHPDRDAGQCKIIVRDCANPQLAIRITFASGRTATAFGGRTLLGEKAGKPLRAPCPRRIWAISRGFTVPGGLLKFLAHAVPIKRPKEARACACHCSRRGKR